MYVSASIEMWAVVCAYQDVGSCMRVSRCGQLLSSIESFLCICIPLHISKALYATAMYLKTLSARVKLDIVILRDFEVNVLVQYFNEPVPARVCTRDSL